MESLRFSPQVDALKKLHIETETIDQDRPNGRGRSRECPGRCPLLPPRRPSLPPGVRGTVTTG
jgi:hypothetical protein